MTDPAPVFYGELYLRSTRPFLAPKVTDAEVDYLHAHLKLARRPGVTLDLGCGQGRHLGPLRTRGNAVVGVDFDPLSLAEARPKAPVVRGDFFRLPFRDGALAGAYAWYNTVFSIEDQRQLPLFKELSRCLKPGGLLVLQGTARAQAEREPVAQFDGLLPDGSRLVEKCRFDEATGHDHVSRELTLPDGRVMSASFFIRYYAIDELSALLEQADFEVLWVHGALDGSPPTPESQDQIVGVEKRE